MTLQSWWSEMTHRMTHHTGDESYQRHHFRLEVERNLRELVRQNRQQTQVQAEASFAGIEILQEGLDQLGIAISDLEATIAWSMEAVAGAISELEKVLYWGFAEITWQQEQSNELLRDILKTLHHPRGIQAEEFRNRGNELYRNAMNSSRPEDKQRWMNLALSAYREAVEYNPIDFSVFHSMGVILFFEKGSSDDALRCFREAAALAEPYSNHHAAMSWLYMGYVHKNRQGLEEAYKATKEALSLDSGWAEVYYQHAVHCAGTRRMEEMKQNLTKAMWMNTDFFRRASFDLDLMPFSETKDVLKLVRLF